MKKNLSIIRQGDVLLVPVSKLPEGLSEVPLENGRIVLMHGEVTGHAHAIADHGWSAAKKIADAAIGLAGRRARLLQAANGTRYLEVAESVSLTHEEHTAHAIPPGYYELPVQMEHSAERMRRVVD
ncbi:hypothetical protein [Hydrocarboniphaga effusa]|uniref:hypothetical protein n=1 Tax=Hydrocarboniphaga effusa TaxID=243629 RepID=UPI00398C02EC